MKRLIVFAAMVVMAVTAQAVSYSWTGTGTQTLDSAITFEANRLYTITITLTDSTGGIHSAINVASGNPRLFALNGANGTNLLMDAVTGSTWWVGAGVNGGNWNNFDKIPTGNLPVMTFTIQGTGTKDGTLTDIFFAYSQGVNTQGELVQNNSSWETLEVGSIESIGIFTSATITGLTTTLDVTSVPVPEPTCLALLALGVAGIALKRKVA